MTDYDELEEISLTPLIDAVCAYRRVISRGMAVTAVVFIASAAFLYFRTPVERVASIRFSTDIDAAGSTDIVAAPVLREVYNTHKLGTYMTFEEFASAMTVDGSRSSGYRLEFRRLEQAGDVPHDVLTTMINDTVGTWARHMDLQRGGIRYRLAMLGPGILNWEAVQREDYLVAVDILRSTIVPIKELIQVIERVPGATLAGRGPNETSLAAISATLEQIQQFEIEPLLAVIRQTGSAKQPVLMRAYAGNQLFQATLRRDELARRIVVVERGLREYLETVGAGPGSSLRGGSVPPPLTGVDREHRQKLTDQILQERMALTKAESDVGFYAMLTRKFGEGPAPADARTSALIEQRLKRTFDRIVWVVERVSVIYDGLSKSDVNTANPHYAVTAPYAESRARSLTMRNVVVSGGAIMLMAFFLLTGASLVHHQLTRNRVANAPR